MIKKYSVIILALVTLSCGSHTSTRVDTWHESPSSTTTKIKVTSDLSADDLKREYINRLVRMGFDIDTENRGTGNNHMETKMRYHENYYVRFFIDFTDNIAVIHGEAGNTGLNGIGQEPAEHNINWKSVTYEGRGWELMSIVAGMSNIKIEYNK